MATFQELKNKLADWLAITSTTRLPDSVRGDVVNTSISELTRDNDLLFGELAGGTFQLLSGASSTSLPTPDPAGQFLSVSRILKLRYQSAGSVATITPKTYEEFLALYPWLNVVGATAQTPGKPVNWTIFGNQLFFAPPADADYTIVYDAYALLKDLDATNTTNDFTTQCWQPILYYALFYASMYLLEDARGAAVWKPMSDHWIAVLLREHSLARHASRPGQARIPG